MSYFVEIVEDETGIVEARISADTLRGAKRIAHGASINLNHDEYTILILDENGDPVEEEY